MFDDLILDNPDCELRLPTTRQTGDYGCIRCNEIKGAAAFIVAAHPTKSGVCRKCCTLEERRAALTLPMWRGVPVIGKTKAQKMFAQNKEGPQGQMLSEEVYKQPEQPACPRCNQPAIGGLVGSILKDKEKVCNLCLEKEILTFKNLGK